MKKFFSPLLVALIVAAIVLILFSLLQVGSFTGAFHIPGESDSIQTVDLGYYPTTITVNLAGVNYRIRALYIMVGPRDRLVFGFGDPAMAVTYRTTVAVVVIGNIPQETVPSYAAGLPIGTVLYYKDGRWVNAGDGWLLLACPIDRRIPCTVGSGPLRLYQPDGRYSSTVSFSISVSSIVRRAATPLRVLSFLGELRNVTPFVNPGTNFPGLWRFSWDSRDLAVTPLLRAAYVRTRPEDAVPLAEEELVDVGFVSPGESTLLGLNRPQGRVLLRYAYDTRFCAAAPC